MNIKNTLKKYFGYEEFRPGQEEIIKSIIDGKNVVAILPTGGGKSICYQIPALIAEKYSIVISPLIALMKDQVDSLNRTLQLSSFINSTLDYYATEKVLQDVNNNKIKLLYVSPEKLENTFFTERIKNYPPDYLFIDEAHCISEWGHNFRPSYRRINNFIKTTGIKKVSAFTATATEEVRKDIIKQLDLENVEVFVKGFDRPNISLNVIRTTKKKEKVQELILNYKTPAIIYTSTRESCEEIAFYLNNCGIKASYYHAGLTSELRKLIQDDFLEGRIDIISATNAFGMGIDKKDIRLVIHYNMTGSIENYYQEFGRAGRDGQESKAYLLYDKKDESIQRYFIENSFPSTDAIYGVYTTICDYARVAVGNGYDHFIPIDQGFLAMLSQKGINKTQLDNSISILETSGYLKKNPDYEKGHFVQIILPKQKLESYLKTFAADQLRDMLYILLRQHGSHILEKKTKINILKISDDLSMDKKAVNELLEELANLGIIIYEKPSLFPSIKIQGERVKIEELKIDKNRFDELSRNLNNKLESIIDYVNSEVCRFKVILNYFGEDTGTYKCGKCDICSSPDASDRIALEFFQEKVLETIHESDGNVRQKLLVDILRGKSSNRDYTYYSNYGSAKHFSADEIENAINMLESKGAIININGMLSLSEKGKNHFASVSDINTSPNADYEEKLALFNSLRNTRKEAAFKFSQPVTLICSDEILRKISETAPSTASELMSIEGFNQRMFNKVGEAFLKIIKENKFRKNLAITDHPDSRIDITTLIKKKYKLEDIASLIKSSEAIVSIQIESLIEMDPETQIENLYSRGELETIFHKISEGFLTLKELKENLPGSINYGKIRIALAKYKSMK